ncbi:MAG: hypothetical protein GYA57_15430 [Myxococcales bacterium]|nr:hypothetical protein [Myxococcales bacterium]
MPPGAVVAERRRSPRKPVRIVAAYSAAGATRLGVVHNLSVGGAFLQALVPVPSGTRLAISLALPGGPKGEPPLEGRVVRVVQVDRGNGGEPMVGMGIEFHLTPAQQERLQRFLRQAPGSQAVEDRRDAAPRAQARLWPPPETAEELGRDDGAARRPHGTPGPAGDDHRRDPPPLPEGREFAREPRRPLHSGRFTLPGVGKDGKPRKDPYAQARTLRLAEMRTGQTRMLRLRLMAVEEEERRPTDFYLEATITCDRPGRMYYLEATADFGAVPPRAARLTVLKSRYDATQPVALITDGRPVQSSVGLEIEPSVDRLVLWISTEGSAGVPAKLAAEVRLQPREAGPAPAELDTLRLPSMKLVVKESLAAALRRAQDPALVALGESMSAETPGRKLECLRRLLELEADVRLIEAAVRELELCEGAVRGFPRVVFDDLSLDMPAHAVLAVFHPGTPLYLVNQCLAIAFEARSESSAAPERRWWDLVLRAATVVLRRRAPALLEENLAVMECGESREAAAALQGLVDWATKLGPAPQAAEASPLEKYLRVIAGRDAAEAAEAAFAVLAWYGFIGLSMQLASSARV